MMKMKHLFCAVLAAVTVSTLSSCHFVTAEADEEAVLVDKPWFFGHGGVNDRPVTAGRSWAWMTTEAYMFKIVPIRYDVPFDDIMSNDNTPLDYATYMTLQIERGKTPILMRNYGPDWYTNNIEAIYRNFVREEISKYSPFDLMSNREICRAIDESVKTKMNKYIATLSSKNEFPVKCLSVVTGRAKPNAKQLEEMNQTAAQIQAKQTQERRREMEEAREKAEKQRAIADKAYQNEMGLSAEQFIQLKAWDIIDKKKDANIDVLFNADGTQKMWNIKR